MSSTTQISLIVLFTSCLIGCGEMPRDADFLGLAGQEKPGEVDSPTPASPETAEAALRIVETFGDLNAASGPAEILPLVDVRSIVDFAAAETAENTSFQMPGRDAFPGCVTHHAHEVIFNDCTVGPLTIDGFIKKTDQSIDAAIEVIVDHPSGQRSASLLVCLDFTPSLSQPTEIDGGIRKEYKSRDVEIIAEADLDKITLDPAGCPTAGDLTAGVEITKQTQTQTKTAGVTFGPNCGDVSVVTGVNMPAVTCPSSP